MNLQTNQSLNFFGNSNFKKTAPPLDVYINNVVASFAVCCHLDLRKVTLNLWNTQYCPEREVVLIRLRSPLITGSIWRSGKVSIAGARSEEEAKKGCRRIGRMLMKLGYKVRFARFRVTNVLATCVFPFGVRIHKFAEKYPKEVDFEPELHPGAAFRCRDLKALLRIFSTGSVTICVPSPQNIPPAISRLYAKIYEFRIENDFFSWEIQ